MGFLGRVQWGIPVEGADGIIPSSIQLIDASGTYRAISCLPTCRACALNRKGFFIQHTVSLLCYCNITKKSHFRVGFELPEM